MAEAKSDFDLNSPPKWGFYYQKWVPHNHTDHVGEWKSDVSDQHMKWFMKKAFNINFSALP